MDGVIESLGWQRYADIRRPADGELNADYVAPTGDILELKIFEEEGLGRRERQSRIADLYRRVSASESIVNIDLDHAPDAIRHELEKFVSRPLQTAVRKASRQIRQSRTALGTDGAGILMAVNNGYSYLDADNFERLVVRRCRGDSRIINYVACITVDYHQGGFDGFVFCVVRSYAVRGDREWPEAEPFRIAVHRAFDKAMTQMMADQMNPHLWAGRLDPVTDICFVRNGVQYIRAAPDVPDSRFDTLES